MGSLDKVTQEVYSELADFVAQQARVVACPIIGINGAQGSGKSTLAAHLKDELFRVHGLRAAILSLDDFYRTRTERVALARTVHPLLATRGVPGTHDVVLGRSVMSGLRALAGGRTLAIPAFSKAADDRLPGTRWPRVEGPIDVLLFEGWCVGTPAQATEQLLTPVNSLEANQDTDGRWRRFANEALAGDYAAWFASLDALIFLRVPDFGAVLRWRWQQEQDTQREHGHAGVGTMSQAQVEAFVQHYERLTRHALAVLPTRADVLLRLGEDHRVTQLSRRGQA